jgi:hypothetical protein
MRYWLRSEERIVKDYASMYHRRDFMARFRAELLDALSLGEREARRAG